MIGLVSSMAVLAGLACSLALARRELRFTTLRTAWWWMVGVCVLWATASLVVFSDRSGLEMTSQGIYWTGIVAMCPGIAVLGAKRPGSRVWNLFIVVPLVLVLGWPAVTVWRLDGPRLFTAEWPVLVGLGLVLVMGTGNYLGTRFAAAAALYAAAIVVLIAPASVAMSHRGPEIADRTRWMFLAATLLLGGAGWTAWRAARSSGMRRQGPDINRLWIDYREIFGIVWGTRLRERLLQEAVREKWPAGALPGNEGLEFPDAASADDCRKAEERYRHHLLWLLRRFVDPEWVQERLGEDGSGTQDPGFDSEIARRPTADF